MTNLTYSNSKALKGKLQVHFPAPKKNRFQNYIFRSRSTIQTPSSQTNKLYHRLTSPQHSNNKYYNSLFITGSRTYPSSDLPRPTNNLLSITSGHSSLLTFYKIK